MVADLISWTVAWAQSPYGTLALFLLAFAESSFFPIPPDVLLIALAVISPPLALLYAAVCTVGSVLGGMFGYLIGIKGGKPILERLVARRKIDTVHQYFDRYNAWAVGIAGFTPIPYKVFTIAAGAFYINFRTFVLASCLGRGGRFFLVGGVILLFGPQIQSLLAKYYDWASLLFVVLLVGGFIALRKLPVLWKPSPEPAQERERLLG
jgi:membrane protein YqaA with SNARE-associated domain